MQTTTAYSTPSNMGSETKGHVKPSSKNLSKTSRSTRQPANRLTYSLWTFQRLFTRSVQLSGPQVTTLSIRGKVNKWIGKILSGRSQQVVLSGERSPYITIESGVPQGSVLGPALFLYYINDMPEGIKSTVRLFADDTIAYLTIASDKDSSDLQEDLDRLARWETVWKMSFHPQKCNVLTHNRKTTPIKTTFKLHDHTLTPVTDAKYLGITFTISGGTSMSPTYAARQTGH